MRVLKHELSALFFPSTQVPPWVAPDPIIIRVGGAQYGISDSLHRWFQKK